MSITSKKTKKLLPLIGLSTAIFVTSTATNATIVEFQTSQGNIQVNLFDESTPHAVNNFLNYVDNGHYTNSVIHRVVQDFIVQGGGYQFEGAWPLTRLTANAAIVNEPYYSNVTGTIAMAKVSGDPDSATDQWFFNLADNSTNLDIQNEGFTVFGQVIDNGMEVINKIADLTLCDTTTLTSIPMVIDEDQDCYDMTVPGVENFVVIENIIVIDSSETTASDLYPLLTKYPDTDGDGVKDINDAYPSDPDRSEEETTEDSGGSASWISLLMLSLLTVRKRFVKK